MTSVFDVLAADDNEQRRNTRRATAAAHARVEQAYGAWIRQDPVARLAHVKDELEAIVSQAAAEYGTAPEHILPAVTAAYRPAQPTPFERTASVEHEAARMPRMCPFHKDVTEISLNSGDPAAGFSAMAQHWGGPRHCEGEGYKGESCKFKPQFTTQSFWDERAEKAEQRKKERAERAELEEQQQAERAEAEQEFAEPLEQETELPADDNVIEVDFKGDGGGDSGEAPAEVPMSMAAATKEADGATGLKGPSPAMDKGKWRPKGEPPQVDDPEGRNPTERKDIVEPVKLKNENGRPTQEIGEQVTEHQDVTKKRDPHGEGGGTWTEGPKTAISAADDVNKNPIIEMMESEFDGFTPQHEVDQAIVAHKRR